MKSNLLRIFFMSWLLSFLAVLFLLYLLAWVEGRYESLRVAVYAAPFWATITSPILAISFTLLYTLHKKRKKHTLKAHSVPITEPQQT